MLIGFIINHVILGNGGMGKTVSLLLWWQQLLQQWDKNSPVPIYIALNEFNQIPESNRHHFILSYIRKNYAYEHTTLDHIERTLALVPPHGSSDSHPPRFLLLMDGFNEITVEKQPLLLELKHLQECCPGIQLVLTSRYDMRAVCNWSDWFLLQLLPLTDQQINLYLPQGNPFQPTLRQLLQNPMMLTLYAATCEVQKNFATSPLCHFKQRVETTAELLWNFIEAQVANLPERVARDEYKVYYYKFLLQFLLPALGYTKR